MDRVLVGAKAIARRLGCSARTVQRLADAKELRVFRLSNAPNAPLRCRRSVIEAFIAEREARG